MAGEATSMLVLAHLIGGQQFIGPCARLLSSAPSIEANTHLLVRDYWILISMWYGSSL